MRIRFNAPTLAKTALIALVCVTALSACQTDSRAGKGQLNLSSGAKRGLQTYMDKIFPTIFAASTNGRGYSYYFCETGGCRDTVSTYQGVLDDCQKRSNSTCRLLAISRRIVWKKANGEAYTLEELVSSPQPNISMGAIDLCTKAYDKERHNWSTKDSAAPYIAQILKRGFTADFCAKLNNQMPQPQIDVGAIDLCNKAFDKENRQWSKQAASLPYITEAKDRGFTSDFCADLTSARN